VILIFVADALHFIPLSKTPFLLAFGWISLRIRKLRWRDVGLSLYRSWPITLAAGVGVGFLLEAFQLFVSQPILVRVLRKQPDLELFRALRGDVKWNGACVPRNYRHHRRGASRFLVWGGLSSKWTKPGGANHRARYWRHNRFSADLCGKVSGDVTPMLAGDLLGLELAV
jgi:hypothetical protein